MASRPINHQPRPRPCAVSRDPRKRRPEGTETHTIGPPLRPRPARIHSQRMVPAVVFLFVRVLVRVESSVPIVHAIDVDRRVRVRELEWRREGVPMPVPMIASGFMLCVGLGERCPIPMPVVALVVIRRRVGEVQCGAGHAVVVRMRVREVRRGVEAEGGFGGHGHGVVVVRMRVEGRAEWGRAGEDVARGPGAALCALFLARWKEKDNKTHDVLLPIANGIDPPTLVLAIC
jgi:hypothetical protein